jgi:Gas vesicle protein
VVADRDVALVDLVDRLLGGGVVLVGDVTLAVADVDLVYLKLQVIAASVSAAAEQGALPQMGSAL